MAGIQMKAFVTESEYIFNMTFDLFSHRGITTSSIDRRIGQPQVNKAL